MEDKLAELERGARIGDPDACAAWIRELERRNRPELAEAERFDRELQARIEVFRARMGAEPEVPIEHLAVVRPRDPDETGPSVPRVPSYRALPAYRMWQARPEGHPVGYQVLATIWPERYDSNQPMELREPPCSILVFVTSVGGELLVDIGESDSRSPSPGTVWSALAPWRIDLKPETVERKIAEWDDGTRLRIPLTVAAVWAAQAEMREEVAVNVPDPENQPSEKQINYILALRRQKGLDDSDFRDLLHRHTGVRALENVDKRSASKLIDGLQELEDAPKPSRPRKPAASAGTPKSKPKTKAKARKVAWQGKVFSVQPRISMSRRYDERKHGYQGFVLFLEGRKGEHDGAFTVGVGKAAQAKHEFQVGDEVSGMGVPVADPDGEVAELYKASKLKVIAREPPEHMPPPWTGAPPSLDEYRERRHRRLDAETWADACVGCIWGCKMPVTLEDGRRDVLERRFETVCFGPKSCFFHEPGEAPTRPKRGGGFEVEPDSVDEQETAHRE